MQTGPCSNIIISSNLEFQKVSKKEGGLWNISAKPQVGGSSHVVWHFQINIMANLTKKTMLAVAAVLKNVESEIACHILSFWERSKWMSELILKLD